MKQQTLLFPHGELSGSEVMVTILEDNRRRLKRAVGGLDDDALYWQPDPQSNSIGVTLWHMGRLLDVFLTQLVKGEPAENEQWFSQGWAERTGYDPRGIGRSGWGSLNDYTAAEVAQIPRLAVGQLLEHLDQVYDGVRTFIESTTMKDLTAAAPSFEGQFTKYQVLSMALLDNVRHLGEIYLLKSLRERAN